MKPNEDFHFECSKSRKKIPYALSDSTHPIAVYTVLCVLKKMRTHLGLEAMLEYTGKLMEMIEKHDPRLKDAAYKTLSTINVDEIYKEAVKQK